MREGLTLRKFESAHPASIRGRCSAAIWPMARLSRFLIPGYPQHLIQRGNNRERILVDEDDYWFLWERLVEGAAKNGCAVHAYVLMPDHFHLVATPSTENGLSKLLQSLGRYYVQYFNRRYDRTGTLWEGRYRATLLDPDTYLLTCSRYVELNPVRKGLVKSPGDYGWSSFACNTGSQDDALVTPHPCYLALGDDPTGRAEAYRASFHTPLDRATLQGIRDSTNKAWVLGDAVFVDRIAAQLNRRPTPLARGGDRRSAAYQAKAGAQGAESPGD